VRQKVKWAKIVENLIEENYPEAKISKRGEKIIWHSKIIYDTIFATPNPYHSRQLILFS
jgi:hypothetical protein